MDLFLAIDFVDLGWVIIAIFIRANLLLENRVELYKNEKLKWVNVLLIFVFMFGFGGQFYWSIKLCDSLFYYGKQSLTHFLIKFQTTLIPLNVFYYSNIFLFIFFSPFEGTCQNYNLRLTHEAQKMFVSGKNNQLD